MAMGDYGQMTHAELIALLGARKDAEELLWLREQEFERLAENIPDLVARFDRDHRYLYVNAAVEKALGISRHAMIGKTQRELGMPGELAAMFEDSLDLVVRTGDVHTLEFSINTPQGQRFLDAYHVPEGGMRHRVETVLCVARDITARRQVEVAQGRLAAIVSNSSDAILSKDLDGVIQTWNPGAARLFGYESAEAVGRPVTMLIPPERREEEALILEGIRCGEQIEHFESIRLKKDGTPVHVSLTISPIKGPGGRVIGASSIARDITERKLAELAAHHNAALARLLESLARASNEAITPEAAMGACLERICGYGRWVIGRVALYRAGTPKTAPWRSIWHTADRKRFEDLIAYSDLQPPHPGGGFLGRALREQAAVWIEDFTKLRGAERKAVVLENGLRSGFVFPVIVRGDVVSILEVFGAEPRPRDPLIIGAADSIASHLARLVERDWAHEANARIAAIVESSHDAIISRLLDGTVLTWNPGAEKMLGYTAAEMVGRNVRTIIPPEFHASFENRQARILRGEAVPGRETMRITKDGRLIDVATSPAPIRDANGEVWAVSTIIREITQRKRREQELRESEERFRQLAENIRQVFWICTPSLDRMVYMSGAYEEIWGRSRESVYKDAKSWMDAIHPADLPRVIEETKCIERGELLDIEYRIVRPDGVERWIRDRSYPMMAGDGSPLACGIAEDVSDWKRAEQELRHAQQRLQVAVRGGAVGLWDWDVVRNSVFFSPEWKEQLGYADDEISNDFREWEVRVHPEDRERVDRTVQQFLERPGSDYEAEFRLRHRDGSYRWILSRASAEVGVTGKVERMVGCHVDVTQQKQAAAEQLEQALSQRDALVREVHHRIKNSLQGVAGLLRQKIAKYPSIAPGIEEAVSQLQSVALVYGLQGTRSDGLLSLAEVTDAICASAENLIGGRVDRTFERRSLRSACLAGSEAVSVAVALNELVFNALKHQRAAAGRKRARVELSETRGAAEIRISNRGHLPREFDFAAGRAVGNGLGLVRALLVSPGGSIAFTGKRNEVEVVLKLSPPLLAERGKAVVT
jgi:PAS domain S-box-containing protein